MTVHRVLRMCRTGLWLSAIWALICGVIWACQGHPYPALACFAIMLATAVGGWRIDPDRERPPRRRYRCGCYTTRSHDRVSCPEHRDTTWHTFEVTHADR